MLLECNLAGSQGHTDRNRDDAVLGYTPRGLEQLWHTGTDSLGVLWSLYLAGSFLVAYLSDHTAGIPGTL